MSISIVSAAPVSTIYLVPAAEKSVGQSFSQAFRQSMEDQQKRQLNKRVLELLDDIERSASDICEQADLAIFQNYCQQLGAVLNEILENAYLFRTERVMDSSGRQRVFATITVIDERLGKLGSDIVSGYSTQLEFISRIDEVRGLITDLFS